MGRGTGRGPGRGPGRGTGVAAGWGADPDESSLRGSSAVMRLSPTLQPFARMPRICRAKRHRCGRPDALTRSCHRFQQY
ncbi:hypothetical protein BN9982_580016 [Mycobacterium tuberculosis]|nr:hypothetical protein BN9982_580016 [Mycobacterium tuberculosis]